LKIVNNLGNFLYTRDVTNQVASCPKIAGTSVAIIIFNCVFYEVRAYTGTVSYRSSTWINYQKIFVGPMTK